MGRPTRDGVLSGVVTSTSLFLHVTPVCRLRSPSMHTGAT